MSEGNLDLRSSETKVTIKEETGSILGEETGKGINDPERTVGKNITAPKSVEEDSKSSSQDISQETSINRQEETSEDESSEERATDEDSTDAESEDEDESPPLLKYTRITSKLPKSFFQRDTISCCNFNEHRFFFGTHAGILHITTPDFKPIQTLKCHRSSIMSIYCDESNFATASMDGTVITGSLHDPSQLTAFDFKRPVHAVVLDEDYKNTKMFVSGGMAGEVILSQRNWLGNRMDITLSKGKGSILGIFKLENTVFWFNDDGITFVDIISRSQLLHIPYPQLQDDGTNNLTDISRPDLFKPHVNFPESDRIIIGWGCNIWSLKVSLLQKASQDSSHLGSILSSAASSLRGVPDRQVELEHHFTVQMIIAGVASFKDDQLMCLGYEKWDHDQIQLKNAVPELRIFDIVTGEEINSDEVLIKNYERLTINDYHLCKFLYHESIPQYYLISATDCINIQELSLRDHYNWYLNRENLKKAWDIAQYIPEVEVRERLNIGISYIVQEINRNNWDELGSKMKEIFTKAEETNSSNEVDFQNFIKEQWQVLIFKALNAKQINDNLISNIPQDKGFDPLIFDTILEDYLSRRGIKDFSRLLPELQISCFSPSLIEERLEQEMGKSADEHTIRLYRDQVVYLYLQDGKYSKAIRHMISGHDKKALDTLLEHPHLIPTFENLFIDIILLPYQEELNTIASLTRARITTIFYKSIELTTVVTKYFPIEKLIAMFKGNEKDINVDKLLLIVLENIAKAEPRLIRSEENEMVRLYAQNDKEKLLPFLKDKQDYDVNKAIQLCRSEDGLYNELIYLWGRIGEAKKALKIIIDELNNPKMAVDYVISWKDEELWDFIITYTIDRPEYIRLFLKQSDILGERYVSVISAINSNIKIADIKSAVGETLNSKDLSLEVIRNILQLVDDESLAFAMRYLKMSEMGKYFDVEGGK